MPTTYTLDTAVKLARKVEKALAFHKADDKHGIAHVALGGGCLINGSSEKDFDLLIYKHNMRQNGIDLYAYIIERLKYIGFTFKDECDIAPIESDYLDDKLLLICGYRGHRVDVFLWGVEYTKPLLPKYNGDTLDDDVPF